MAPPTNKPVLGRIDPAALALETARRAISHIASLQTQLLSIDAVGGAPEPERTEIYGTVHRLAHYAVTGEHLDAPVHEYLVSLIPLWLAVEGPGSEVDVGGEADPDTELGLVIVAALAREQMDTAPEWERLGVPGKALTATQLATLAGISATQVRQLVRAGELAAEDGAIEPAEARRWLAARGVPGITARAARRRR